MKTGGYTLRANIGWNEAAQGNVYSSAPQIEVAITGKNGLVASFAGKCDKVSSYNMQTLERQELFALEELLDERFIPECFD